MLEIYATLFQKIVHIKLMFFLFIITSPTKLTVLNTISLACCLLRLGCIQTLEDALFCIFLIILGILFEVFKNFLAHF
jgi:hypothetical protein